jgi:hypothetical protein
MIMSLNNINQLIFVMAKYCVLLVARVDFLNIIQMSFGVKGLTCV